MNGRRRRWRPTVFDGALLPQDGKNALTETQIGFVPFKKQGDDKKTRGKKGAKGGKGGHGKYKKGPGGRKNVLKTFRVRK